MWKGRVGQAADVDDVGPAPDIRVGAPHDLRDRQCGCLDDLGEDADVVAAHILGFTRAAEEIGNVLELVRPALEGHAEILTQTPQIGAAAAGKQDLVGLDRLRQAALDDLLGHQGRDFHADIQHLPVEPAIHGLEHGF